MNTIRVVTNQTAKEGGVYRQWVKKHGRERTGKLVSVASYSKIATVEWDDLKPGNRNTIHRSFLDVIKED